MAGTDRTQLNVDVKGPVIILVQPALPENVGTVARAMGNCGLQRLRLVKPKWVTEGEPFLHPKMLKSACGADFILDTTEIFDSLRDALHDVVFAFSTSARRHTIMQKVYDPIEGFDYLENNSIVSEQSAVVFGCEKYGLCNEDISLTNAIISIPLNPAYTSLNLAQAVLLLGYEWSKRKSAFSLKREESRGFASKKEMFHFIDRLEAELDKTDFLRVTEKRKTMLLNIRNIFTRSELSSNEVQTLEGVLTALVKR